MTLSYFQTLDEMEQAEILWEYEPIDFRIDGAYKYTLYQIDAFYVEARYHTENNVLTGLSAFDDTDELEPYLNQLHLSGELLLPDSCTLIQVTTEAINLLPKETIQEIKGHPHDSLIDYHLSLGAYLRNNLNLWHRKVVDEEGKEIHPDDVSMKIIEQIWVS